MDEKKLVSAPIRYGRLSEKRGIYTMVFSSQCLSAGFIGKGYLVPLLDGYTIHEHSKTLIKAERNSCEIVKRYNHGFFAVGLLVNPHSDDDALVEIVKDWGHQFKDKFEPNQYGIGEEIPIIDQNGFLNIKWSQEFGDYDYMICTVIKAELDKYPDPFEIAEKMIEKNDYEYFCKNRNRGISTFQVKEIEACLP